MICCLGFISYFDLVVCLITVVFVKVVAVDFDLDLIVDGCLLY